MPSYIIRAPRRVCYCNSAQMPKIAEGDYARPGKNYAPGKHHACYAAVLGTSMCHWGKGPKQIRTSRLRCKRYLKALDLNRIWAMRAEPPLILLGVLTALV